MSRDEPDVVEIIRTVDEFVAGLMERLEGGERYDALCARYLLKVAERELDAGAQMDRVEQRRLEVFLGEHGALEEMTGKLARSIRAGAFDSRWDEVFEVVLGHVINKVAVSRPAQLEGDPAANAAGTGGPNRR
jgi:hypothetical protein